jgi:hypothetical protein
MRIPLKAGRAFTVHDRAETPPVVVINESLARRVFAGADPIGKRLTVWRDEKFAREIIGVVGDVKSSRPRRGNECANLRAVCAGRRVGRSVARSAHDR